MDIKFRCLTNLNSVTERLGSHKSYIELTEIIDGIISSQITLAMLNDAEKLAAVWTKASELAVKFLPESKAVALVRDAARQLRDLEQHTAAAQLYLSVDGVREAVDVLVEGRDWNRARKIAQELEPSYFPRVDAAYRDWLRSEGRADQLADVDLGAALELLVQQGQWDQALQKAQQNGTELLNKYAVPTCNAARFFPTLLGHN